MRGFLLPAAVLTVAACGGGGDGGGAAVTRDSAGIAIVENTGPVWSAGQEWKVDSVILDIGGDVDSVSGPVRLGDGRLAIANAGSHEVRVYDAAGAQLHASGRAGDGPGEYRMLAGIWRGPGDSLLVSDFMARRVSVLDRDAKFARSF